jgi:hypothetical protein
VAGQDRSAAQTMRFLLDRRGRHRGCILARRIGQAADRCWKAQGHRGRSRKHRPATGPLFPGTCITHGRSCESSRSLVNPKIRYSSLTDQARTVTRSRVSWERSMDSTPAMPPRWPVGREARAGAAECAGCGNTLARCRALLVPRSRPAPCDRAGPTTASLESLRSVSFHETSQGGCRRWSSLYCRECIGGCFASLV